MSIKFQRVAKSDLPKIKEIYDWYIKNSVATFHTEPISVEELQEFIYIDHIRYESYLIYLEEELVGYCFLTPYKKRQAYDRSAEVTIYLKDSCCKRGVGSASIEFLEERARVCNFKTLLGVITGTNSSSIALFERLGYQKCAHFKSVGEKFNQILDVVAYQKEL